LIRSYSAREIELITTHKKPYFWLAVALTAWLILAALPLRAEQAPSAAEPAQTEQDSAPAADPNETPAPDDESDPFNLTASSLILIQEAYSRILTCDLITDEGLVDYATLRRKRVDIITVAAELESLNPALLMSLSRQQRIAFWINTYNVCMIKLIIDRYPIEPKWYMILYPNDSIMQIPNAWTNVYFNIQKLEYNLKEIEQNFLLDRYKDPRICFALAYASVGGANLRNEPYTGSQLDEQLNDQVKNYLRSEKGMRLDKENKVLYLSNIFQMHKKAFLESEFAAVLKFRNRKPEERAWLNFILPYMTEEDAYWLEKNNFTIKFIQYDWHLNEKR